MKSVLFATVTLALTSVFAYHDPDLNYHISQAQKLQNCGDGGYSYPAPAVQLSTAGVKVAAAQPIVSAPAYQYLSAGYTNAGYSTGVAYQAVAPKITYAAQPATTYQTSSLASNYATSSASNEVHGYATSAGLSSVAAPQRTVVPQATYAQAPIIAKVTAAPLFARFSVSPAKTTYVTQASGVATSAAKASLNSYSTVQSGGPVVSQVYSAQPSGYATSPALRVQPAQAYAQVRYTSAPQAPTVAQYHQAFQPIAPVAQLGAAVTQYSSTAYNAAGSSRFFSPGTQYSAPAVARYSAPVVTQYAAPAVAQYAAPQVASVTHHGVPAAVSQAVQYSAPTSYTQYSSPSFQYASSGGSAVQYAASGASASQYSSAGASAAQYATSGGNVQYAVAPAVTHVAAPIAVAALAPRVAAPSGKNVHTDFLENYDAHPRYAYEYAVNDPHTGDIKQQKEERDGEVVKGQYSLVEPDGSVRTVNYVADWETGFHADVHNSKQNQH